MTFPNIESSDMGIKWSPCLKSPFMGMTAILAVLHDILLFSVIHCLNTPVFSDSLHTLTITSGIALMASKISLLFKPSIPHDFDLDISTNSSSYEVLCVCFLVRDHSAPQQIIKVSNLSGLDP